MTRRRQRTLISTLILALLVSVVPLNVQPAAAHDLRQPVFAWYYGWWTSGNWQKTSDLPVNLYDSNSDSVMRRQIREARGAGIDGFICTWQYNCRRLLQLAEEQGGFSVAIALDPAADGSLGSFDAIVNALGQVDNLANSPAFARIGGKPVVVWWDSSILPGDSSVAAFRRLRDAADSDRSQYWLGGGVNFDYLDVFDAMHYYDISWESSQGAAMASYAGRLAGYNNSRGANKPFVATVMPGYDDIAYRGGHKRDRQHGGYYHATWDDAFEYDADIVVITSWNEWHEGSQIEPSQSYGNQYLDITRERATAWRNRPSGFADSKMHQVWERTDRAVRDSVASRSWVWGFARTNALWEEYDGRQRLVQYFDKSRMEINDPNGDRNSQWFVTNGLLVREMISGRLQLGDNAFENRTPSDEVLAGDPRSVNPNVPGYGALANHQGRSNDRTGQTVAQQLQRNGSLTEINAPATARLTTWVSETGHNIPDVFWDYLHREGLVWNGSWYENSRIVDWLFAFGYPIAEPYWIRAKVGSEEKWVLVQAFERRVLTWTPTNDAAFQVEMGNVGQHYHAWRYGWSW
jgi:hypothetical protein